MTVHLTLPSPPSVNKMFKNVPGIGRAKTSLYKSWIMQAGLSVNRQKPSRVEGPYRLSIAVPQALGKDIDNVVKPLVDLLVTMGVTDDDKHMQELLIQRAEGIASGCITLTVEAA